MRRPIETLSETPLAGGVNQVLALSPEPQMIRTHTPPHVAGVQHLERLLGETPMMQEP